MASDSVHVGKPPFFDGTNYDYWKTRMMVHLKSLSRKIWRLVDEGYIILEPNARTALDNENDALNDQAMNVLYSVLDINEFNRIKSQENALDIWVKLMEIHEGTSTVKDAKLFVYKGQFGEFAMMKDEDVPTMFNRLNKIVNELKNLGYDVPNEDFSHKFLRCLPEKYDVIVAMLVREDLKMTPTQVLGEVTTHEIFKKSQQRAHGISNDDGKKSIALKAQPSKEEKINDSDDEDNLDEKMALFVRKFKKFMKNKNFD
jgi:hypothetical protein